MVCRTGALTWLSLLAGCLVGRSSNEKRRRPKLVGIETGRSQAYPPFTFPRSRGCKPMKKKIFAVLLSTAAVLAGPVACSGGGEDKAAASSSIGAETRINKAAMDKT